MGTVGSNMSLKIPVIPPGIDPGIARVIAQRLNHYDIPGPRIQYCIQHFNIQLMHTTLKNVELHFKISQTAPTCFGLQGNHHQGATSST